MFLNSNLMDVAVITIPGKIEGEIARLVYMFDSGLEILHLRKPKYSKDELEEFILSIPKKYHSKIIIHGHYSLAMKYRLKGVHLRRRHRSNSWKNKWKRFLIRLKYPRVSMSATFHSLQSLKENQTDFDYVFLSQVFATNSSFNHSDTLAINTLKKTIEMSGVRVFATGGVSLDKLETIKKVGFHGVGLSNLVFSTEAEQYMNSFMSFKAA
jgi:thiamine-phosphate pyrophosphorylase